MYLDGTYSNEFEAAYDLSRRTQEYPRQRTLVDQHVADGKFVLVLHAAQYCRHTDALLESSTEVVSVHETRAEADAAFQKRGGDDDYGSDFYYMVYPPVFNIIPLESAPDSDDCPF